MGIATQQLLHNITSLLQIIVEKEGGNIRKAGTLIAKAIAEDRIIHILGTGAHSQIVVEDVLWRAGGLAAWNPIIDPGTSLVHGAKRSIAFERCYGYGTAVLNANNVGAIEGELMIIINAYGIDPMSLDIALGCKERGVFTIGVTSPAYGKATSSDSPLRHPSKKNLFEVVDLLLNSHVPLGDAAVEIKGFSQKVASYSTFCSCFVMNALVAETVSALVALDIEPPVFMSANLPGGDEANVRWENKYGKIARYLL